MKTAYLIRTYFATHTLGVFTAVDENHNTIMECSVLELPWKDNTFQISCIPEGKYRVIERRTDKFKRHYHIQDVPNRTYILQHPGNFTRQIEGCQLPGDRFASLNNDKIPDILNTRSTLDKMLKLLGKEYTLFIGSFEAPVHEHKVNPAQYWIDSFKPVIDNKPV